MNEFEIIELIRRRVAAVGEPAATLMAGDDCAVLEQASGQTCLSVDTLIADTHFPADAPPELIGRRALAVCASDLAAMGASPRGCLLGLGLPPQHNNKKYISSLADGLAEASNELALPLLGGNLSKSDTLFLSITVIGNGDELLSRAGAVAGDDIYLSGTLGDAAAGLKCLSRAGKATGRDTPATPAPEDKTAAAEINGGADEAASNAAAGLDIPGRADAAGLSGAQQKLVQAYYLPPSRLGLGTALRGLAHCCIDVSDGLAADLLHLLQHSEQRLKASINLEALPCSPELRQATAPAKRQELMLYGGDDYELLFTVPANKRSAIEKLTRLAPITKIGVLAAAAEHAIVGVDSHGKEMTLNKNKGGYQHF